jgi:hypothetical protein
MGVHGSAEGAIVGGFGQPLYARVFYIGDGWVVSSSVAGSVWGAYLLGLGRAVGFNVERGTACRFHYFQRFLP